MKTSDTFDKNSKEVMEGWTITWMRTHKHCLTKK